jgi:hypothetical protein
MYVFLSVRHRNCTYSYLPVKRYGPMYVGPAWSDELTYFRLNFEKIIRNLSSNSLNRRGKPFFLSFQRSRTLHKPQP